MVKRNQDEKEAKIQELYSGGRSKELIWIAHLDDACYNKPIGSIRKLHLTRRHYGKEKEKEKEKENGKAKARARVKARVATAGRAREREDRRRAANEATS